MNVGNTVYYVTTHTATLKHQQDGVELFRGEIFERDDDYSLQSYVSTKELLYFVGKKSYSSKGKREFSDIGVTFPIPFVNRKVFEKLNDAQQEMIRQIFAKEKWLK
jgi:hypothetical protein